MGANETVTAKAVAEMAGVGIDAIRARWKAHLSRPFSRDEALSREEVAALLSGGKAKPKKVRETAKPASSPSRRPAKKTFDFQAARDAAFNATCVAIVVAHAGLIWYDCWALWSAPGAIGGGIAFLVVLAALLLATDSSRVRTSETALWVVAVIDAAAWFAHYPTFMEVAKANAVTTGALAGLLCAFSFAALYLFRDHKLD